jgi:hypothetical protein
VTALPRPQRIQLRRTRGWRKPDGAVVVARPSRWGNPFLVGSWIGIHGTDVDGMQFETGPIPMTAEMAVAAYRDLMTGRLGLDAAPDHLDGEDPAYITEWREALAELTGRDLACWCRLVDQYGQPVPCHADVLLDLANSDDGELPWTRS